MIKDVNLEFIISNPKRKIKSIKGKYTVAHSPEMNDIAEYTNSWIVTKVCLLLLAANPDNNKKFRLEAFNNLVYIFHWISSSSFNFETSLQIKLWAYHTT